MVFYGSGQTGESWHYNTIYYSTVQYSKARGAGFSAGGEVRYCCETKFVVTKIDPTPF